MPHVTRIPGILLPLVLIFSVTTAMADQIVGKELEDLMGSGIWVSEHAEIGSWEWAYDGSICLRLPEPTDPCADNGTWKIEDDVICYKLTWWGSSVGDQENCFTLNTAGDGRYETVYHGGSMASTFFFFQVQE